MSYVEDLRKIVGHHPLILVGAVVIIIDTENRILLQKRRTPANTYGIPGGLMELGESTEDTARREVFEETGLTVGKLNLIDVFSGPGNFIKLANGDEFHSVTVAYYTKEISGDFKIDEKESLGFEFVDIANLPENIVKSHRRMIEKLINTFLY